MRTFHQSSQQTKQTRVPYGTLVLFDGPIPMLCVNGDNKEQITINFKMSKKRLLDTLKSLNFEITVDYDIFFLLQSSFTDEDYQHLVDENKSKSNFEQFAYELLDIIRNAAKYKDKYTVEFTQTEEGGKLIIQEITKMQIIDIITLNFSKTNNSDDFTRGNSKIEMMKIKLHQKDDDIKTFFKTIKQMDPILYDLTFKQIDTT